MSTEFLVGDSTLEPTRRKPGVWAPTYSPTLGPTPCYARNAARAWARAPRCARVHAQTLAHASSHSICPCSTLASLSAPSSSTQSAHTPLSHALAGQPVEFLWSRWPWTALPGFPGGLHVLHVDDACRARVHLPEHRHEPSYAAQPHTHLCPLTAPLGPRARHGRDVGRLRLPPPLSHLPSRLWHRVGQPWSRNCRDLRILGVRSCDAPRPVCVHIRLYW